MFLNVCIFAAAIPISSVTLRGLGRIWGHLNSALREVSRLRSSPTYNDNSAKTTLLSGRYTVTEMGFDNSLELLKAKEVLF